MTIMASNQRAVPELIRASFTDPLSAALHSQKERRPEPHDPLEIGLKNTAHTTLGTGYQRRRLPSSST
jgi:hypothetical protein